MGFSREKQGKLGIFGKFFWDGRAKGTKKAKKRPKRAEKDFF
jgi:hypothetical protein